MTYYLMVWTLSFVTFSSIGRPGDTYYEWKNISSFATEASCQKAAATLGYTDSSKWRFVHAS
jgi:hypothetical protein